MPVERTSESVIYDVIQVANLEIRLTLLVGNGLGGPFYKYLCVMIL